MGERFSRSWSLAKESMEVLRRTPSLMWFPVISGIVSLVLTVSFFVPVYLMTGFRKVEQVNPYVGYPLMFAFYFLSYFVVIFFNSGLVACAHRSLSGQESSFKQGLSDATSRLPAILGWTLIATTVGVVLQMIAERSGIIGRIITGIFGAAWNIVTYFVVPIVVVEKGSPVDAIKKSGSMLKKTWGENLIGSGGIGFILALAAMVPLVPMVAAFAADMITVGLVLLGFSVLYWLALAILGSSLQGVYQTALYVYAETGTTPSGFSQDTIANAFRTKEGGIRSRLGR